MGKHDLGVSIRDGAAARFAKFLQVLVLIWTSLRHSEASAFEQILWNYEQLKVGTEADQLRHMCEKTFSSCRSGKKLAKSSVKSWMNDQFDPQPFVKTGALYTDTDTNLSWKWAFLDLPEYINHKLRNPANLTALQSFQNTPDFMLAKGNIWPEFQEELMIPPPGVHSVVPVFFQMHVDGVTVRRDMHVRPTSLLHGNMTIYNLGEQFRRMPQNRIRLFLTSSAFPKTVCDKKFPTLISDNGSRQRRVDECKAEKARLWQEMVDQLGAKVSEWFEGFQHTTPDGEVVLVRLICTSCIFDLPQISELTGQVS